MTRFQMAARFQQVLLTIATVSAFALIALVIMGVEKLPTESKTAVVRPQALETENLSE